MGSLAFQPRIIRAGQAPGYCGMNERLFNKEIRPKLTVIKLAVQGIGFDRFEIDEALDQYIAEYGRAPEVNKEQKCKNEERQDSLSLTASGISTRQSMVSDFAKAAKQAKSKKLKSS
tara:strand:+ start:2711 stop:3061 length:351 start_codon:yes stop_codon:yes gene_type:complete